MQLGIGIDTGGTFTDGVIVDLDSGTIVSKAKVLTTRQDLRIGIEETFQRLDRALFPEVRLVSLSTTLATNSVVEGKGARVGLIAAVPSPATFSFPDRLPADRVALVAGSHDNRGNVAVDLDLAAAEIAVGKMAAEVDSFAVSSYFSIYNAAHELRLKEMIAKSCGLPVVCGHELSGAVGMVERAVTAALNARLLPVIRELLGAVGAILKKNGIRAPIMVVKGDGSLIGEDMAACRPVETVLSGPAASIAGACRLTGLTNAIVADMGGTTTDIGVVKDGMIATADAGAVVGGWQTRVHAVDMWTVGLGGDSRISLENGAFKIGPRRAIPLCAAAEKHPELLEELDGLLIATGRKSAEAAPDFYTLVRRPAFQLSRHEQLLVEQLDGKVRHKARLAEEMGPFVDIERFVQLGLVAEISFTPTDLVHARGALQLWDAEAAEQGALLLARRAGLTTAEFLDRLHAQITSTLALQLAAKSLHEDPELARSWTPEKEEFLLRLLRLPAGSGVSASMTIARPVIAVGAPVHAYFPAAAAALGTGLIIPQHAEVANAFGAVTGRVVEKCEVHIRPEREEGYTVAASDVQQLFGTLEEAVAFAEHQAAGSARAGAERRGGEDVVVTVERKEEALPLPAGWGDTVLIEVMIVATAVGRPRRTV